MINAYLAEVYAQACARGYKFDAAKVGDFDERNLAEFRFRIRINRAFGYKFAGFLKFIRNLSGFCRRIINLAFADYLAHFGFGRDGG